jgi:hypothetical protein
VLIGFQTEDDWFEYRLENHPEFLRRVAEARATIRAGLGTRLEDLDARFQGGVKDEKAPS